MKQSELVDHLAGATGLTKRDVASVLALLGETIQAELSHGDSVKLPGVGKLSLTVRSAKTGRHPHTGEPLKIAAKRTVKFKPTKTLAEALNPVRLVPRRVA